LNPFGATVGPPGGVPPLPPLPGQAPGQAPEQHAWQKEAFAPTAPPTADDHEAARPQPPPPVAPPPVAAAPPAPARVSSPPAQDPETVDANAPRSLAGFLVSYEGNELGVFHTIHQGQNLVGRKGAAPGLAIELEHGTTSSRHAMLFATARPGRLKIEDLGSTNGTFVGELMLERGKRHELKDGDVVRFGGYVTIVKII
jgi:hypothetical protein